MGILGPAMIHNRRYQAWCRAAGLTCMVALLACGSRTSKVAATSSSTPTPATNSGATSSTQSSGPTSQNAGNITVGQMDGGPGNTALPSLPQLTNVVATEREDSVGIDFDPVDGAIDYRVYPLPDPSSVTVNADGSLTIPNTIYRCAGQRETFDMANNVDSNGTGCAGYDYDGGLAFGPNAQCPWQATIPANPTLGYVYVVPGDGLVPVYAVGVYPTAPEVGWRESRPKIYTTDTTLQQQLLSQGGRDDGIVFYVPEAASSSTQPVYHSEDTIYQGIAEYYFGEADVASHASDATPPAVAFQVLSATANGAVPLQAVFYEPGNNHTELSVGNERFKRAAYQGVGPLWHLEWSGMTQPTTLVVEALSSGCPFQGLLATTSLNAQGHQPFFTLEQLQQASPTGEVFINGQYDLPGSTDGGGPNLTTPNASPIPIARSFVQVTPQPHNPADWDWYQGFSPGTTLGTSTPVSGCLEGGVPGYNCVHYQSSAFDITGYRLDEPNGTTVFTYGSQLGQLWTAFDDAAQDVTGKIRFGALQTATVNPNTYLHITWSVTMVGTNRRYPQVLVSDQPLPVQAGLSNPDGNTLILQSIEGPSMRVEAQAIHGLVNGMQWDVNNQAPNHPFIDYDGWNANPAVTTIPPSEPPFDHAGLDRMTKFDVYISSTQTYLFMDGTPGGCTQYPSDFTLNGTVTITFGDVLYHELAEMVYLQTRPFVFMNEHQVFETKRQWDDLGFKSGVPAPEWNDTLFPCEPY